MNSCLHKIHQFSLNDCWSKLLWHMFYIFLTYGFGYGLRPKAEDFQGRTFGYGRSWKLRLRSNTGNIFKCYLVSYLAFTKSCKTNSVDVFPMYNMQSTLISNWYLCMNCFLCYQINLRLKFFIVCIIFAWPKSLRNHFSYTS